MFTFRSELGVMSAMYCKTWYEIVSDNCIVQLVCTHPKRHVIVFKIWQLKNNTDILCNFIKFQFFTLFKTILSWSCLFNICNEHFTDMQCVKLVPVNNVTIDSNTMNYNMFWHLTFIVILTTFKSAWETFKSMRNYATKCNKTQ